MLGVAVLQFNNPMIIGGIFFSFVPAAAILNYIQERRPRGPSVVKAVLVVMVNVTAVFLLTFSINKAIKSLIHVDSDEHIYKFVLSKFGFGQYKDFDVKLYVCNEAFGFLEFSVVTRLTSHLTFPPYVIVHVVGMVTLLVAFFQSARQGLSDKRCRHLFSNRPDLAYHFIQTVFYGALAFTTLRMKYLWTPYVCVFAPLVVCDAAFYTWVLNKISVPSKTIMEALRHVITAAFICALIYNSLPAELKNLENLREFWDPDTVELMEWINNTTPKTASFSGSMQLLAGVKLCTGRPITNHPHYEDKGLRKRTKELYSYYARVEPKEVQKILKKYKTSYIIMEDSICLHGGKNGCTLKDILDVDRGEIPQDGYPQPGLKRSSVPRFCYEVRKREGDYGKYFKIEFENKTFKVYKVL